MSSDKLLAPPITLDAPANAPMPDNNAISTSHQIMNNNNNPILEQPVTVPLQKSQRRSRHSLSSVPVPASEFDKAASAGEDSNTEGLIEKDIEHPKSPVFDADAIWKTTKQAAIDAAATVLGASQVIIGTLKDKIETYSADPQTKLNGTIPQVLENPASTSDITPTATDQLVHKIEDKTVDLAQKTHSTLDKLDEKGDHLLDSAAQKVEILANKANVTYNTVKNETKRAMNTVKQEVEFVRDASVTAVLDLKDALKENTEMGKQKASEMKAKVSNNVEEWKASGKESMEEAKMTAKDMKEISAKKLEEAKQELKERKEQRKMNRKNSTEQKEISADIDTDAHKPNLTDFEHDATVLDVE